MARGQKGIIDAREPRALTKLGLDKKHWTTRVKGIGSGYWRVVGEVDELIDKAKKNGATHAFRHGICADFEQDLSELAELLLPRPRPRLVALADETPVTTK
jgi:hypothetical protein